MLARKLAQFAIITLLTAAGEAAAQSFTPSDEKPEDYPDRRGREEIALAPGTPCHGFRIVAQQGQTRRAWDRYLEWMTERYNMPPPRDSDRSTMLDYLEAAFPPLPAWRGWQNPFQK